MTPCDSVVDLLRALVRIPSVNPAGNPGTDRIGEQQCAEFVYAFLKESGADAELREVLPGRPNVVGRFPSDRPGKPRLLFAPHTDTVSVAGMSIDPFGGEVRDGRVWGRGASDTKGSMAAMLWGLREARDIIPALPYEVWFAGLVGEEAGQQGAKALAEEEPFAFVIAGEPTGLDVVYTHKGCTNLRIATRGRAAHSASPSEGENAIYKMAEAIELLRNTAAAELAAFDHPVLGHSTLSVGTIAGGSKTNIVPDFCEITVDIRTVPSQNADAVAVRVTELLRAKCPDVEVASMQSPPLYTDPAHPLIGALRALGSECVGAPWFCDAAVFSRKGIPAIALGPGSIAQAHTKDEWIYIRDLEEGARFFADFLRAV